MSPKEAQLQDALRNNGPALPDIFHAIEQQLGLRLEPSKTPIDILIVDHADKVPIAN
jgi:uncharacterized protein (TIGR03435 family)